MLDGYGHVSARDPRHPDYFFLASALAPALVTAADIMAYDLDAHPIEARERSMYAERFIHGEIYRARPDVHAVVHSHSPTVIPFGVSRTALRPIYHMASFIPQSVPVFEIRDAAGMTDLLIRTNELGRALGARTLGPGQRGADARPRRRGGGPEPALLRRVPRLLHRGECARLQLQALTLAGPLYLHRAEEAAKTNGGMGINPDRAWDMWVRSVAVQKL